MHDAPAVAEKRNPQRTKMLLSRQEACSLLSISLSTLNRLVASGGVDIVRIGRRVLVPSNQLDRLAKTGCSDTSQHATGKHAAA